jgi:hypothetical protein
LFLALDAAAWGRVVLAVDIARELRQQGDEVSFIAGPTTAPVVKASKFAVEEMADHLGPLAQMFVEAALEEDGAPDSIVLCDFHSCSQYFAARGMDLDFLLRYDVPVIAMDIWNCYESMTEMDLIGGLSGPRAGHIERFTGRLVPAPINRPTSADAYCALPRQTPVTTATQREVRQGLGLAAGDRAVLFCTGAWQHEMKNADRRRLAEAVPSLLWAWLSEIDHSIRLIHIGPVPLKLDCAPERYIRRDSVTPKDFNQLLGSVDLFLSANISATTIGRALVSGLPVVAVRNSSEARTAAQAEAEAPGGLSRRLSAWLQAASPLYPFSVWPLGYTQFLKPLLHENPYCEAIEVVELLDEASFLRKCGNLLFDETARAGAKDRQAAYVTQVRQLPRAAELIDVHLN